MSPSNPARRTVVKSQPSSEDRIIDMVVGALTLIGKALALIVGLWLGYDLFAPLYHLPLANPLNIAGGLACAACARQVFKK